MGVLIQDLADRAEAIYATRLKDFLEQNHRHEFVAIEPISGDYFVGKTASEAANAADEAHPDRLTHVLRIGHEVAVEIGILPWFE